MRESDRILSADLREVGLTALAGRAESGEWNEYFGRHALPLFHLVGVLREEVRLANVVRKRLIENVKCGKYDATEREAQEWSESPEGRQAFQELMKPR